MTTAPLILDADDFEATFYGVPVCSSGEDGDMIALGHPGARRVLAACNRYARTVLGLDNLADDRKASADDWFGAISERWGIAEEASEEDSENYGYAWTLTAATANTPGATAYTWISA